MQLREDWIRTKIWEPTDKNKVDLILPDGVEKAQPTEDDIFFHILEVGPDVKEVKVGMVVGISFMSSDMIRMRLPEEKFKCFFCREGSVIGILRKQP